MTRRLLENSTTGDGPSAPLVGAHMSAAGGLVKAVERLVRAGGNALQIFTKNSNQWKAKPPDAAAGAAFTRAASAAGVPPDALSSHAAYLINLASSDPAIRARSVLALADEIARCDVAGISWLVLHPGSHGGDGEEAGLERIARGLDEVFKATRASRTTVLLETAAGQGACLGHDFSQLADIIRRTGARERLAVCFDTCHVHAAGHDLVSRDGWDRTMDALDRKVGLGLVKLVHANDSKRERGCRVDRHERIGQGAMGEDAFANLMREPALAKVPKVLETPKDDDGSWDREGIALLRRLAR